MDVCVFCRIGAKVIDVGGCSTRPGAKIVTAEEEMSRVFVAPSLGQWHPKGHPGDSTVARTRCGGCD